VPPTPSPKGSLPRNVKLLGLASMLNDIASEMIYPLLPHFLLTVLGGNRVQLGVIEGVAESTSSLLKLWSGGRSDRATPADRAGDRPLAGLRRPDGRSGRQGDSDLAP